MLLALGCGKPITERKDADRVFESPKSIFLRSVRSFDSDYHEDASIIVNEQTAGSYSIPVMIDMTASYGGRWAGTWLHIEHNNVKHCYIGYSEYYYDHSRRSGTQCSSEWGRFSSSRMVAIDKLTIHMRIEKSVCNRCEYVMAEVDLTRI